MVLTTETIDTVLQFPSTSNVGMFFSVLFIILVILAIILAVRLIIKKSSS
jgi:cytochrome bd-type quinol oxidase subunit 1